MSDTNTTTIGSAIVADLRARIEAARTFGHQAVLTPVDSIEILLDGYERMRQALESRRIFTGYDDDEAGIGCFTRLEDAKAYAEHLYLRDGGDPVEGGFVWRERKARTDAVGYPDMWDLEDGGYVVHGAPVFPDVASAIEGDRAEQEATERELAALRAQRPEAAVA